MATTGSMTAAVWLAPMVPTLPLPLAQRAERLLTSKPGRETEVEALWLCEGILAYAACVRVGVAVAVLPSDDPAARTLGRGVAALRRAATEREVTTRDWFELLVAASDAIEAVEPGHPLGRAELSLPRTTWVARTQLVEALDDDAVDEGVRRGAVDGGIAGVLALWVRLIELRREVDRSRPGDPPTWLGSLGDLIVDVLNSSVLAGAELAYPVPGPDGAVAGFRRLHGLEGEDDARPGGAGAIPGVVCWRFDEREISSHGLLRYWVDEHEFDHVGILVAAPDSVEHLDYGAGVRSPEDAEAAVDWAALRVDEGRRAPVAAAAASGGAASAAAASVKTASGASPAAATRADAELAAAPVAEQRARAPIGVIAAAILAIALVLGGGAWLLSAGGSGEPETVSAATGPTSPTEPPAPDPQEPEPVAELVIAADEPAPEPTPGLVRVRDGGDAEVEPPVDAPEPEALETASLWFESERSVGTCQITYEGRTRTANLHLKTRQPEGKLEFSYRCGEHRGRGSVEVKRNRVNGVLFCKKDGAVKVKTVRTNEGRCDR